jgi:hypothetical protein
VTVEQAKQERDEDYQPPLKAKIPNIALYRRVFLGFPIWGESTPPVICSFLAKHDLSILHGMTTTNAADTPKV